MMGIILHYMRTREIGDFKPERLIRDINKRVNVDYNEQLDRQYAELSRIDRYVVDNYKIFMKGCHLGMINITNYDPHVIGKKLASVCDHVRMNKSAAIKKYEFEYSENDKAQKVVIYTLKSREQMSDLWDIIDYRRYQEGEL
jgi:hypothetical protein